MFGISRISLDRNLTAVQKKKIFVMIVLGLARSGQQISEAQLIIAINLLPTLVVERSITRCPH